MKKFSLLCICVLISFVLSGCWDKRELEDNTFVILMGIDQAEDKNLIVTAAFPLIQAEDGSMNQGEDNGSGNYTVISVKAPSLIEGLNMLSTKISGPLALYTVKTIVISQEIAQNDLLRHIFSSWRYKDIRNTANILISECKAYEFIGSRIKNPVINPLRQEELLLEQINKSSYYKSMQLLDLMVYLKSNSPDTVAMYGGISQSQPEAAKPSSDEPPGNGAMANQDALTKPLIKQPVKEGYLPSELPIQADNKSQISGLAVLRDSKMVGILNSSEAQTYLMLTQSHTKKTLTLPDPLDPASDIVIEIMPSGKNKLKTSFKHDLPVFDMAFNLNCNIESIQSEIDYGLPQNYLLLTEYINKVCTENIQSLITKIQKEYQADILKLGNKLAYRFLTAKAWENYNWPEKYKDAEINFTVNLNIENTGIILP